MRYFWALLLSFTIPLQGFGSSYALAQQKPCPMEQAVAQQVFDDMGSAHDCCNDADTAAQTGDPCKPSQDCQLSQTSGLPPGLELPVSPATSALAAPPPGRLPSFDPSSVWRPPTRS
jgi:hypothetical protein